MNEERGESRDSRLSKREAKVMDQEGLPTIKITGSKLKNFLNNVRETTNLLNREDSDPEVEDLIKEEVPVSSRYVMCLLNKRN